MTVYKVHFTWKEKEYSLKAQSLDLTHPYFVSITELILPEKNSLLLNVADDTIRTQFAKTRHLMIPFQSVSMIEEFKEDPDMKPTPGKPILKFGTTERNIQDPLT